jgi:hypothetical protein
MMSYLYFHNQVNFEQIYGPLWDMHIRATCQYKILLLLDFYSLLLLVIIMNRIYKLMWWFYRVSYNKICYYDVVGYSSNDVTSVTL